MILALLIFLATSIVFWYWYIKPQPDEPPILPGSLPFVGHGHLLAGNSINFWNQMKDITYKNMKIGHASYFYTGFYKIYVLTDPDDIYKLSNTCFQKDRFSYEFTKELLGDGLLFSEASTWKRHRKLISPAFNQQILEGFISIFNEQGRRLVNRMEVEIGKSPFDHSHYVRQNFMETICLTVFDTNISEDEAINYVKAFESYLNYNMTRFQQFWLHSDFLYNFSNLKKKQDSCIKYLHEATDSILRKKRAQREFVKVNGTDNETNPKLKIFMDLMLDYDGKTLTDNEIRDEMNTLIMAGHDTSANVVVFALILIGSYPDVQERIYNELREVLKDRNVEKHDLTRLVYLEAVLKETMRYYVMAPFVLRYIDQEVKLKNCTLKPGHNCMLLLYGVHRNYQWGSDVEEFKPERWLDPAIMPKNPNIFAGFSIGKRNCIGKTYAMMSMKVLLCHLLRRYKLHADNTKLELKLDILLKPVSGHFISIEDRLKTFD